MSLRWCYLSPVSPLRLARDRRLNQRSWAFTGWGFQHVTSTDESSELDNKYCTQGTTRACFSLCIRRKPAQIISRARYLRLRGSGRPVQVHAQGIKFLVPRRWLMLHALRCSRRRALALIVAPAGIERHCRRTPLPICYAGDHQGLLYLFSSAAWSFAARGSGSTISTRPDAVSSCSVLPTKIADRVFQPGRTVIRGCSNALLTTGRGGIGMVSRLRPCHWGSPTLRQLEL